MTTKQKTVQTNYSAELSSLIVAEYTQLMGEHANDNKQVLSLLSEKYGKSVPSLRAKLASLKVYMSADKVDNNEPIADGKPVKKEEIANAISNIVGTELSGLEAATKAALQNLLTFLLKVNRLLNEKEAKIESLIAEMLEDEPYIADDINDDD